MSTFKFLLVLSFLVPQLSLAAEDFNTLKQGAEVKVTSIHKKPLVLGLTLIKEPAVGPNYAKVSDFAEAVKIKNGVLGLKKILKSNKDTVFTLQKNLKVLTDQEIEEFHLK